MTYINKPKLIKILFPVLLAGIFLVSGDLSLAQNNGIVPLQTGADEVEQQRRLPGLGQTDLGLDITPPPANTAPSSDSNLIYWLSGLGAFVLLVVFAYFLTRPEKTNRRKTAKAVEGSIVAKPYGTPYANREQPDHARSGRALIAAARKYGFHSPEASGTMEPSKAVAISPASAGPRLPRQGGGQRRWQYPISNIRISRAKL